jgi:ribulose-5-phosphate 4-epimerase/fuculose-1-phosphate aldolase
MSDVRDEMCAIIDELYRHNLMTPTGGNVSARTRDNPNHAWITPKGLFKGQLTPDVMVRVDADGSPVHPSGGEPSSEVRIHTAILRARPDIQAVVHCHAPKATILVNAGLPFLPISTESAFLAHLGRIPFIMPGTEELATALVAALGQGWGVLMQNHGLIVGARSLRRAADITHIIERTAEVILGCYAVGREPPVLPADVVQALSRKADLMA